MKIKSVSLVNLAVGLLWLVSCTVAHSRMLACVDACATVTCRQAGACPDDQARFASMPTAPSVPQAPHEHECRVCEHHAQCSDIVPGNLYNTGSVKQPAAPAPSSHAASPVATAAGACGHLPERSVFASTAHARLTCLRTTLLRI